MRLSAQDKARKGRRPNSRGRRGKTELYIPDVSRAVYGVLNSLKDHDSARSRCVRDAPVGILDGEPELLASHFAGELEKYVDKKYQEDGLQYQMQNKKKNRVEDVFLGPLSSERGLTPALSSRVCTIQFSRDKLCRITRKRFVSFMLLPFYPHNIVIRATYGPSPPCTPRPWTRVVVLLELHQKGLEESFEGLFEHCVAGLSEFFGRRLKGGTISHHTSRFVAARSSDASLPPSASSTTSSP